MAAPGVYSRTLPSAAAIERGFKSKFTLGLFPGFAMYEFSIIPGKLMGGPPIIHSSFFNNYFHTKLPQVLVDVGPFTIKGKYDSDVYKGTWGSAPSVTNQLPALINKNGAFTFLMPNLGTLSNFGWVREVDFGEFKEGDTLPPLITLTVEVSNFDPVNRVEAGWSYVDGYTGTSDG